MIFSKDSQCREEGGSDSAPVRWSASRLFSEQGDGKCAALRGRQFRRRIVEGMFEEVAKPGECQLGLRADGATRQNPTTSRLGMVEAPAPKGRLAYSGLALEQERPNTVLPQECVDLRELSLTSDDARVHRDNHAA